MAHTEQIVTSSRIVLDLLPSVVDRVRETEREQGKRRVAVRAAEVRGGRGQGESGIYQRGCNVVNDAHRMVLLVIRDIEPCGVIHMALYQQYTIQIGGLTETKELCKNKVTIFLDKTCYPCGFSHFKR